MLSPALYPHDVYGIGSQTPSLMNGTKLKSSLTFTLAIGRSPAPPQPRSSVTNSKMPREAWQTVSSRSQHRQDSPGSFSLGNPESRY